MIEVSRGRYKVFKKINLLRYSNSNQSFEPSSMGSKNQDFFTVIVDFNMNNFMKKSNVKKLETDWKW